MKRFFNNCKPSQNRSGNLTVNEITESEISIFQLIETASFSKEAVITKRIVKKSLDGLYRVRTKLMTSVKSREFRLPVLLPSDKPLASSLIKWLYVKKRTCRFKIFNE